MNKTRDAKKQFLPFLKTFQNPKSTRGEKKKSRFRFNPHTPNPVSAIVETCQEFIFF